MSGLVDWIGAEADDSAPEDAVTSGSPLAPENERALDEPSAKGAPCEELAAHSFPAGLNVPDDAPREDAGLEDAQRRMIRLIAILICGFIESARWACCGATCAFR